MRNLWIFISKYNAFFFFLIFFGISFVLLISNNTFQKASVWNSSNQIVGQVYQQANEFENYVKLSATNDSLAAENARLRNKLEAASIDDSVVEKTIKDTVSNQQYTYIVAEVVNNSVHRQNNFLTINRGIKDGLEKGMGVIGPSGVVGIVRDVSQNFARIQSLLHSETRFSAIIEGNIGSMVWGEGNIDSRIGYVKDIPTHVTIKKGTRVLTSGFSLFPKNVPIGTVIETGTRPGDSFLNIKVRLSTDFQALEYVYVVKNSLAAEQQAIETEQKPE